MALSAPVSGLIPGALGFAVDIGVGRRREAKGDGEDTERSPAPIISSSHHACGVQGGCGCLGLEAERSRTTAEGG
jgi:hypothetical protein